MLVKLFERIQFFLQRLKSYTNVPLTVEMTELLGKIMAQILSVVAFSTKTLKERRISESSELIYCSLTDCGTEKFVKRLAGRTDVENALQRLDLLTKEEELMTTARNLEVTHRVDDNVATIKEVIQDVDGNIRMTKELTHNVDSNVMTMREVVHDIDSNLRATNELTCKVSDDTKAIEGVVRNIDDNVEVTKIGTHR
jgi:methyl-accepting chemotaxis protein